MSKSLIARVNSVNNPDTNKSLGYGDYNLFGGGYSNHGGNNRDLTRSEYGAAQASQLLVEFSAGIAVWEQFLDGIKWNIKDTNTGDIIISTDERVIDENAKGATLFNAIKDYRDRYNHSYWKSIADSDFIAGETYIRFVRNRALVPKGLQWLNPLATYPQTSRGQVDYFTYSNDDSSEVGHTIPMKDMAYRMFRRNIFDDLRGYSPILSVIDEANLSRNVKRAFRQYFRNGMILGGLISPEGDGYYNEREQKRVEDQLLRNNKGTDNAHSWIVSPRKIFVQQFDSKDASKDIAVLETLRGSMMMAIGVPEELAGNPADTSHENLDKILNGWYKLKGVPYAKDIAEYHNTQIIPVLDGSGIYLEPDLLKYETERPEVVSQDVDSGIISIYDAQIKRGQSDADEGLKDIYKVGDRLMHRDIMIKVANTLPSDELADRASAEESLANAEATSEATSETESAEGEAVTSGALFDENGTAIPQSEVFGYHIESGIVDINEARAQLGLPPIEKENASDADLVQLNSQLQTVITAINAGMGVAEAYESVGLEPPKEEPENEVIGKVYNQPVIISHSDHDHVIPVVDSETYTHDKALAELKTWKKFHKKDAKRSFAPTALRGDIADGIALAMANNESVDLAFDSAFETLKAYLKTIQSVRLDFEDSVEGILIKARDDNNFGRTQFSSAMRKIIRSSSTRAYEDGLISGGVLDGKLSESDQDTLSSHISAQSKFVTDLGAKIFKTEDGISDALASRKPVLWFNKSVISMYDAGQLSANGNRMMEFTGKDGKENCPTCKRLKGQRHRHKAWARRGLRPDSVDDSDNFDCGLWECNHHLTPVAGKARGGF